MTAWMLWAVLATALLGFGALCAERALVGRRKPTRWIWAAAIAATMGLQLWSWLRPHPSGPLVSSWFPAGPPPEQAAEPAWSLIAELSRTIAGVTSDFVTRADALDRIVALAWPLTSALFIILLTAGLVRMARAARGWRRMRLDDQEVLVAPDFGPALVGIVRPKIVFPEWALELDRELLRIAWLHEAEHRAARDTLLLFVGALAIAATPWNVALWWMVARLRAAVEIDCDSRVLRAGVPWARYGEVLLDCAARVRRTRVPGLALGRPIPLLERRLTVMTTRPASNRFATVAGATATAVALTMAACEGPAPTGVSPAPTETGASLPVGVSGRAQAGQELSRSFALGDGDPLIVVDGEETDRSLSDLDPLGVARVEVLRGAAAREWYGERGANGVVVVTTSDAADAETLGRVMGAYDAPAPHEADAAEPDAELRVRPTEEGPGVVTSANLPDDVEVYVDGVLHDGRLDEIDPDRIDRIEVLRGEGAPPVIPRAAP